MTAGRAVDRVRSALVLLTGVMLFCLVGVPYARACDCMPLSFEEAVEQADMIAEITIVGESGRDSDEWGITYVAAVERVWKGEESREIRFTTAEAIPSCGLGRLPEGKTLLVWASGADGRYSSTWCDIPAETEDDVRAQLTRELGEPADLSDQPVPTAEGPNDGAGLGVLRLLTVDVAAAGLILLVGVAALVGAVILVRRSARAR